MLLAPRAKEPAEAAVFASDLGRRRVIFLEDATKDIHICFAWRMYHAQATGSGF